MPWWMGKGLKVYWFHNSEMVVRRQSCRRLMWYFYYKIKVSIGWLPCLSCHIKLCSELRKVVQDKDIWRSVFKSGLIAPPTSQPVIVCPWQMEFQPVLCACLSLSRGSVVLPSTRRTSRSNCFSFQWELPVFPGGSFVPTFKAWHSLQDPIRAHVTKS